MRLTLLFTLLSPLAVAASDRNDRLLTVDNWSEVLVSKNVWVVEYYSNMCGSCKEFEKTWGKLARSLESEYAIARVSIDSKPGMALAKAQGVLSKGIPAVQVSQRKVWIMRWSD